METTKFKPLFNLVAVNKEFIRTVAVASTDAKLKSWKEILGPSSLPIIGQLLHFMPGGQFQGIQQVEGTMKLYESYGPIVRFDRMLSQQPMVLLYDPECSEHILRSENSLPVRPGFQSLQYYRKELKKSKGHTFHATGLITEQGELWKEFRSTVNPVMLQPKTIKQYATVLDEVAQDMVKRLKANRNGKNMISKDFDKEMNLWALESIVTVALGCRLNCFDPNLPADSPEWQLIQCVHDLFDIANELDFKPSLWRWFSTPMYKKAMKLYEHHENLTKHFIQKGKEQLKNQSENEKSVLGKLLEINEELAHNMASDMLFAGVDTAANTVTATLYLLAKHPDKQAKLREEIMSNSERRPYLRACVKESLRIMPVASANIRKTSKEYNVLGYKIPKDVLRSENWYPVRPGFQSLEHYRKDYRKSKGIDFHATGLISDHGEVWKEFRSTVNPVMLQPKTIKLYATVLDEVAQDMIARMRANRDEKNMIKKDFDKEMNLWALESIGTVALGCRLNCFDPNLPADSPEWQLIQCVHNLFVTANEIDFKPNLWRLFSTPMYKKAMKLYEHHENLTKYFIKMGKDNLKNKSTTEKGVLEKLLDINEEAAHIMASDMLFAGVDTAANTVTATLYLLAKNPEKQDKLREETMSNSEKRPYLRACIKESLRMMPVVSGNARKTSREYNLLGYKVPKDVDVVFAHREMSLMEKHYPRADEYIPERWVAKKDDPLYYGNAHPFVYGPFGYGARSCIGRRIAELEMDTFVARLIENFQVEWFGPPPKTVQQALNYIKGPYNFVFKDIK